MSDKDKIAQLDLELSLKEVKPLIKTCLEAQEPVMLWGGPGIGKSDIIHQLAAELPTGKKDETGKPIIGREVIDIRLSLMGSEDIKGYPYIDKENGRMKFSVSNEFPTDPESTAILFFDEINQAIPTTQLAMYQLILGRKIGEYELPKGVSIVAAGNREQDKAGIFSMPKPLENRFAHVEIGLRTKDWLEWAVNNDLEANVIGFIGQFPERLYTFNPSVASRAFATPRSWSKASKLISAVGAKNDEAVRNVVASCVGAPLASEFMSFQKLTSTLPSPEEICSGKVDSIDKIEASLKYVLIMNILHHLRETHPKDVKETDKMKVWWKKADNFLEFLLKNNDKIDVEFFGLALHSGFHVYKLNYNMKEMPALSKLLKKHENILGDI